jgi:hypothetical protein
VLAEVWTRLVGKAIHRLSLRAPSARSEVGLLG